jgi:hypothetical protein
MKLLRNIHTKTQSLQREMYTQGEPGEILPPNFDTDNALGELPFWLFRNHAEISAHAEKMKVRDSKG